MPYCTKVQAKIEKYMGETNAWDYLPHSVRKILQNRGYKRTEFSASVIPADDYINATAIFKYRKNLDNNELIHLSDLKMIEKAGVGVLIVGGRLCLHLKIEDYYQIKEQPSS